MQPNELIAAAAAWQTADPDPETGAELARLITAAQNGDKTATAELRARFAGTLEFGTAGLRAKMGAGPARINRVTIAQTSKGLANFLKKRSKTAQTGQPPRVVIGYDARHKSREFAQDTAEIMQGAGLHATLLPSPCPTPLVAFAVRELQANAGVMITASHNPPADNGYKVYLGGADRGHQIVPPQDGEIASEIKQAADTPVSEYTRSRDYTRAGNEIVEKYVAATAPAGLMRPGITPAARPPRIIYTAMHGTGGDITEQVFAAAKLPRLLRVASQFEPDGDFPTVEFPNPEETGALDAALQVARELNADAIIAHDPDADRLAVAVPHKHSDKTGDWRILTGNEIGLLLGWRAAARAKCRAQHPSEHPSNESSTVQDTPPALACTIVSSPALRTVAEHYELAFYETLSGFKWVGRVPGLIFGFEEALGYLVDPAKIGDKDGISAAATIAAIINELHAEERTLLDKLDDASEKFGHFASRQITVRLDTGEQVAALADRLRTSPVDFIGGLAVRKYTDLLEDSNFTVPANVLRYDLAGGARLMIRPSGTEPKLKIYLDVHAASGSLAERKTAAAALLDQLETGARNLLQHAH